jgi:ankyrin repeat protein
MVQPGSSSLQLPTGALPSTMNINAILYSIQPNLIALTPGNKTEMLPLYLITTLLNNTIHAGYSPLKDAYQWLKALPRSTTLYLMNTLPASIVDPLKERIFAAAIKAGDEDIVQNMLALNADPWEAIMMDQQAQHAPITPLEYVTRNGSLSVAKKLVQHMCRSASPQKLDQLVMDLLDWCKGWSHSLIRNSLRVPEWVDLVYIVLSARSDQVDICITADSGDFCFAKRIIEHEENDLGIWFRVDILEKCLHGVQQCKSSVLLRMTLLHGFETLKKLPKKLLPPKIILMYVLLYAAEAQQRWAIQATLRAFHVLGYRFGDDTSTNSTLELSITQAFHNDDWAWACRQINDELCILQTQIRKPSLGQSLETQKARITRAIQQRNLESAYDLLKGKDSYNICWRYAIKVALKLGTYQAAVKIIQRMEAQVGSGYYGLVVRLRYGHTEAISTLLQSAPQWQTALEAANKYGEFGALADLACRNTSEIPYLTLAEHVIMYDKNLEQIVLRVLAYHAIEANDYGLFQWLLKLGMDIDEIVHCEAQDHDKIDIVKRPLLYGKSAFCSTIIDRTSNKSYVWPSLLAVVAQHNRHPWIKFLLDAGADGADSMALLRAVEHKAHNSTIHTLLRAAKDQRRFSRRPYGTKALASAVLQRDLDTIDILCEEVDVDAVEASTEEYTRGKSFLSPMGTAIVHGENEMLSALLQRGASPNAFITYHGLSLLDATSAFPSRVTPLLAAIDMQHVSMVMKLVESGAEIDYSQKYGLTRMPLQRAAEIGHFDILRFLVDKRASIDTTPVYSGATALQLAAMSGYVGIVAFLLEHGANPNFPPAEGEGRTAFEAAAEWGRIDTMLLLMQAGVQLDMKVGSPPESQYERARRFAEKNGYPASKRYVHHLYTQTSEAQRKDAQNLGLLCSPTLGASPVLTDDSYI